MEKLSETIALKSIDLESTKKIASYNNNCTRSDFKHYSFDLYLTAKGNIILHEDGGALTHCSRSAGNNSVTGGELYHLLNKEEAWDHLVEYDEDNSEIAETIGYELATL